MRLNVVLHDDNWCVVESKEFTSLDSAIAFATTYIHCQAGSSLAGGVSFGEITYDKIPDACPKCAFDDDGYTWYQTAVDVTCYSGNEYQFNGGFDPSVEPDAQAVRVSCIECSELLPLAKKLYDELAEQA